MEQSRGSASQNGGAPRKRGSNLYLTLAIGFTTWVVVGLSVFFGVRWLVRLAISPNVPLQPEPPSVEQPKPMPPEISQPQDEVIYTELAPGDEIYTGAVSALVTIGFPDFTEVAQVPLPDLISFGVWQAIKEPRYSDGLSYTEDRVYVEAEYVEQALRDELGYAGTLAHQSVAVYGEFKYDALSERYTAPSYGIAFGRLPVVRSCNFRDGLVTLTVDCYSVEEREEDGDQRGEVVGVKRFIIDMSGEIPKVQAMETVE